MTIKPDWKPPQRFLDLQEVRVALRRRKQEKTAAAQIVSQDFAWLPDGDPDRAAHSTHHHGGGRNFSIPVAGPIGDVWGGRIKVSFDTPRPLITALNLGHRPGQATRGRALRIIRILREAGCTYVDEVTNRHILLVANTFLLNGLKPHMVAFYLACLPPMGLKVRVMLPAFRRPRQWLLLPEDCPLLAKYMRPAARSALDWMRATSFSIEQTLSLRWRDIDTGSDGWNVRTTRRPVRDDPDPDPEWLPLSDKARRVLQVLPDSGTPDKQVFEISYAEFMSQWGRACWSLGITEVGGRPKEAMFFNATEPPP